MNTILGELGKNQKFREYIKNIESQKSPIAISGLTDVGMVQMIAATNEFSKKPICIITYNEIQAKQIYENIKYFTDKVVVFPKKEIVTYDNGFVYEKERDLAKYMEKMLTNPIKINKTFDYQKFNQGITEKINEIL